MSKISFLDTVKMGVPKPSDVIEYFCMELMQDEVMGESFTKYWLKKLDKDLVALHCSKEFCNLPAVSKETQLIPDAGGNFRSINAEKRVKHLKYYKNEIAKWSPQEIVLQKIRHYACDRLRSLINEEKDFYDL